jgi:hypothetical protein
MADQWYYGTEGSRQGPFTPRELLELATSGQLRPTDTVWKEGVPAGVPAHRVKNLFPSGAAPASAPAAAVAMEQVETAAAASTEALTPAEVEPDTVTAETANQAPAAPPEEETPASPPRKDPLKLPPKAPPKRGRATALRGAVIAGQDGESVYFRKKCIKCGHEETGRSRLPIRNGVTRSTYFCPKCRKVFPVEIQGMC